MMQVRLQSCDFNEFETDGLVNELWESHNSICPSFSRVTRDLGPGAQAFSELLMKN